MNEMKDMTFFGLAGERDLINPDIILVTPHTLAQIRVIAPSAKGKVPAFEPEMLQKLAEVKDEVGRPFIDFSSPAGIEESNKRIGVFTQYLLTDGSTIVAPSIKTLWKSKLEHKFEKDEEPKPYFLTHKDGYPDADIYASKGSIENPKFYYDAVPMTETQVRRSLFNPEQFERIFLSDKSVREQLDAFDRKFG